MRPDGLPCAGCWSRKFRSSSIFSRLLRLNGQYSTDESNGSAFYAKVRDTQHPIKCRAELSRLAAGISMPKHLASAPGAVMAG
jgi:hypothetical protein